MEHRGRAYVYIPKLNRYSNQSGTRLGSLTSSLILNLQDEEKKKKKKRNKKKRKKTFPVFFFFFFFFSTVLYTSLAKKGLPDFFFLSSSRA